MISDGENALFFFAYIFSLQYRKQKVADHRRRFPMNEDSALKSGYPKSSMVGESLSVIIQRQNSLRISVISNGRRQC